MWDRLSNHWAVLHFGELTVLVSTDLLSVLIHNATVWVEERIVVVCTAASVDHCIGWVHHVADEHAGHKAVAVTVTDTHAAITYTAARDVT